jgi:hypothetical protein
MRNWLFFIFVLPLFGCEQDVLVPCNADLPTGKLCREYRYYNDVPQGFVEFDHLGDSLNVSRIFNANSELTKTVLERFAEGKKTVITEQFPDGPSRVQSWNYNEMDSLSLIVYGANDSVLQITYAEGKRFRETALIDNVIIRYRQFRYYQDDGMLYRISEFDGNDSLTFYSNYNYFSSNGNTFTRVSRYTSGNELVGRRLFTFSQLGLISSMEFRLADGTVAESKEYIYDGAGKLIEEYGQFYGNSSKSVYLYN